MGTSTEGIIFCGVKFEEGTEFPWDESHSGEFDKWYACTIQGYVFEEVYDENGEYLPGKTSKDGFAMWDRFHTFQKENPPTVQLVYTYGYDYTEFALAIPSSVMKSDGVIFDPKDLTVTDEEVKLFTDVLDKHIDKEIETKKPLMLNWYLCGFHG